MANPTMANVDNVLAYSPQQAIELVSRAGVKKANMRPDKIFLSACSAGALLGFAGACTLSINASPWYADNAPGLLRMIGAIVFPLGLVMIVLTGADLFTGTNMYTAVAALDRRISIWKMLIHWVLCFWGNLAGALFLMAIIFGYGGVFEADPFLSAVQTFVHKKQAVPAFYQIFLKAIGCNWLVCLACYLGMQGRDLASKVIGLWWPIFAFVSLGLDHVVANMFIIPMGIWLDTPDVTVGLYIWKGIIPAALGNMLGGALFCGMYYWWMYSFGEQPIAVDGVYYDSHIAMPTIPDHRRRSKDLEHGQVGSESENRISPM
ncbi:hypothetical protein N0V93_003666 [Gnomoniopsis smithogilvyi]|uniref:Formate/nitrite transporter n=1 Tax=Gnomoniopsis smithogilvyi TaxID=1191159 RepID=A0A9W8YZ03_9PEZI|nr:hypothetical protein N0V93_003666 [Gnomoniopsis smithogilvyi]